jgi:DNA-binding transcriptional regulator YiaG
MSVTLASAQVEAVEALEKELSARRKQAAATLRIVREGLELSLRDVAPAVNLTAAGLSNLEIGKSWRTETARRIAQFYASLPSEAA